jgi:uncharacterized membrane protein
MPGRLRYSYHGFCQQLNQCVNLPGVMAAVLLWMRQEQLQFRQVILKTYERSFIMKSLKVHSASLVSCLLLASVAGVSNADYDSMLNGADVTAQGNYPEWSLTISKKGNKVSFTTDSGTYDYKYPAAGPTLVSAKNTTVYNVPNKEHVMNIQVKDVACEDSVTGTSYGSAVFVWLDDAGYAGCGNVTR